MIEFALINNGGTDVALRELPDGMTVPVGDLAELHRSAQRVALQQADQAVLAEELGFHYFFLTEHHFQTEGTEYNPNPLMIEAYVAARTQRIRLGQMANILAWHHPVRLAEQGALLDILSGGRLEFGVGRGAQPRETEVFGQAYGSTNQDQAKNRAYFEEAYEIIVKAWTEPSFSYRGQFFTIPPTWTYWGNRMTAEYFSQPGVGRAVDDILEVVDEGAPPRLKELSVFPQPVQKPYPQVWASTTSPRSNKWAARQGINVFCPGAGRDAVKAYVAAYYDEADKADYPDRLGRGRFKHGWDCERKRGCGFLRFIHIAEKGISHERLLSLKHFIPNYAMGIQGTGDLSTVVDTSGGSQRGYEQAVASGAFLHGSKQLIIDGILADKEAGEFEDYIVLAALEYPGMSTEVQDEQMRAFAEEIMPVLQRECGGSPDLPDPMGRDQIGAPGHERREPPPD
jgi:alkanesulfonate monooxygenase SsuD/methylene tetrahydromethanopterin reductase-like flavin-dependent oxidoreductase (luciferase family)